MAGRGEGLCVTPHFSPSRGLRTLGRLSWGCGVSRYKAAFFSLPLETMGALLAGAGPLQTASPATGLVEPRFKAVGLRVL